MAKLTISEIVSSANPVPAINRAIQTLVSEFNNKVVYRSNPVGENNTMSNDLDMGDNDILNAGLISCASLLVAGSAEVGDDKVLSTLNTANVPLTTTPTIISGNTDIVTCSCIERLVDGSIRYNRAGNYIVTFTFKVATTSNTEVYFWIEKWNGAAWDIVPYSGIIREMPSLSESEISASYIRSVDVAGEIYCIMGSAASDSGAVLSADILPSGATMPSIRIDIRGR